MPAPDRCVHIVDDDDAVRASTAFLLEVAGYSVQTWSSGSALLDNLDPQRFCCVLLDLKMPRSDGLEVQQALRTRAPLMPVVILTGHGDINAAIRAMRAGAVDFLEKPVEKTLLMNAIENAFERFAGSHRSFRMMEAARTALASLSEREADVLDGLSRGLSNKGIAVDLAISPRTVEIHRANIMTKLAVSSLSQALRIAFCAGIGEFAHHPPARRSDV